MPHAPSSPDAPGTDTALQGWRLRLYTIIFESDTRAGRTFDIALIGLILLSVAVVVADSMPRLQPRWHGTFIALEWVFTVLFTVEYVARLVCLRHPLRYALSFFGLVDLVALLPTYLALFFPELHVLIDVRVLRLMRIFRIFKLTAYMSEYQSLGRALRASRRKITVFVTAVAMVVLVLVYMDLLTPASLKQYRKQAIVGLAVLAAVATPIAGDTTTGHAAAYCRAFFMQNPLLET